MNTVFARYRGFLLGACCLLPAFGNATDAQVFLPTQQASHAFPIQSSGIQSTHNRLVQNSFAQNATQPSIASNKQPKTPTALRLPLPRSQYDISHQYYVGLLRLALQKAAKGRDLPRLLTSSKVEQADGIKALTEQKLIDVFWVGTDRQKEQQLRAIKIPLERGLMGFRKFTIVRTTKNQLDQIHNLADLKKLRACVGSDWPDRAILEHAGLPILAVAQYEELFAQLAAGACDYFPRGLHEGKAELSLRAGHYPQLVRYQDIMLHYPFAVYFFTSPDNEALAQWIEEGLELLIQSGELLSYMQQHPLTRHVFPLSQYQASSWITLENPILDQPKTMALPRYWFLPADFQ